MSFFPMLGRVRASKPTPVGRVSFEVNMDDFSHTMREYGKYMFDKDMPEVIRQQSGLLATMLMKLTPPMVKGGGEGLSKGARKGGELRVAKDIRKVFRPAYEAGILRTIGAGSWDNLLRDKSIIVPKITNERLRTLIEKFTGTQLQKQLIRNYLQRQIKDVDRPRVVNLASRDLHDGVKVSGRVPKGVKPYFIRDAKSIDKYITLRQQSVGRLKAGWYFAAKGANVSKYTPNWVTRHMAYLGRGRDRTKDKYKPTVELTNFIADRDRMSTKFKSVQKAVDLQEKNMRLVIERIARRNARRAFFQRGRRR